MKTNLSSLVFVFLVLGMMVTSSSSAPARNWRVFSMVSYDANCSFPLTPSKFTKYSGQTSLENCMISCINDRTCAYFNYDQISKACFVGSFGSFGYIYEQNVAPRYGYFCGAIPSRIQRGK